MEIDELQRYWKEHSQDLERRTRINTERLNVLLNRNARRRMRFLRLNSALGLVIPPLMILVIILLKIPFSTEPIRITATAFFALFFALSYAWTIKFHRLLHRADLSQKPTAVRRQLHIARIFKLKSRRRGLILAPFAVVAIFISAGIPILSDKMILFYLLMGLAFSAGTLMRKRFGLAAQLEEMNRELSEIDLLESESIPGRSQREV